MLKQIELRNRARAAGFHFLISLAIAALAAVLVLAVWYPGDYAVLSGGRSLFWLLVSVDVVMGPLLTLVVFDVRKSRAELVRDLAIIGLLQLAALVYGLSTVYQARPVALVFEVDRFRVVNAADVLADELPQALPEYRQLPLGGPWLLSARESQPGDERLHAIELALKGFDLGQRPSYWQAYSAARSRVLGRSRPIAVLLERRPQVAEEVGRLLSRTGASVDGARFLPAVARIDACVVVDRTGEVLGFVRADGFF
jgi:hypothetical protein